MVYPREEKLDKLSQEEIISNTKLVMQGLEALKNEHNSILHSLLETIKCLKKDEEANLVHEKSNLLRKSVEMIELGLGEAQVRVVGDPPRRYPGLTGKASVWLFRISCRGSEGLSVDGLDDPEGGP